MTSLVSSWSLRTGIALCAVAGVAAVPRLVHAGCGGGHGGGGGSHGGGGHGGGSWHTVACEDDSDVVGLRHCSKFGSWGSNLEMPVIVIEGGALMRRFPTLLGSQTGNVLHGDESFAYRVMQPARGARPIDTAVLSTLRASVVLPRGLYGGLELDLGGLTRTGQAATEMMSSGVFGSPSLAQDRGFIVDSLGVFGVRGATGFGGLGVELAGGVRTVSYRFQSDYHDCEQTTSVRAVGAVAEARARGELWLGPWITAGVTVGASLLERNAWMGGVFVGVHSRAFGGGR
jgi:hypothetical protein